MDLITKIPLKKHSENPISYESNILLLGSCFVENIGGKLDYYKFQNLQNPFGILFNPIAIETLVLNAVSGKKYSGSDTFLHNEQWHSFEAHSKLSHASKEKLLSNLNNQINLMALQLNSASHIVITLGTAWVYRHIETSKIVANCHKVPQKAFLKELLTVEAVSQSLESILKAIRSVNTKASVIFTVSPVRHIKDGFVENTQSKSHLITAIHQFLNSNSNVFYFPSFEIMMDELRDYRFYTEDMLHPNQTAINYIWEKFKSVWISEQAFKTMDSVEIVQKGMTHKPFNPNSEAHKTFLENLEIRKGELRSKFPHIKF
ncbi:GSCFA domain-containing protein [Flavobacteriaceae bacterium XHP0103]|uniref:GSCFA domain-containing protein n=1 Tax=Marixanthotalea marina TaxID=2844359 RepID=UPI00298A01E8|nr:GSCFA domain-containing protein [Marixanthotalea marina]MBU3821792.1 GSCFA domain-containing protein [Marixanthotalea marina]